MSETTLGLDNFSWSNHIVNHSRKINHLEYHSNKNDAETEITNEGEVVEHSQTIDIIFLTQFGAHCFKSHVIGISSIFSHEQQIGPIAMNIPVDGFGGLDLHPHPLIVHSGKDETKEGEYVQKSDYY